MSDTNTTMMAARSAKQPLGQGPYPQLLLGRYRIMATDASGGFGTVLTCWDTRLQRRVAIKCMPLTPQAEFGGVPSALEEALSEARTSSMLAHPNIVTVYDFEIDRNWAYLVMEYVDGLTLSELLSRVEGGTLTNDECAYLLQSIAKALSYAHENGVLHLDIKPSNIMIDRQGIVKLCDFGMATLASATGYGGARGGTVGYMPPEQIVGGMVDERSDVFSLAVVIWQSLTGENAFAAATAEESLKKIERGPRRSLSKLNPTVTGMAEELVEQALSPNQAQRIPSVQDFADELGFSLGDAAEGAASVRALLNQTENEEDDGGSFARERLPLSYRYPWMMGALARAISAGTTLWASLPSLAVLLPLDAQSRLIAAALLVVAATAWPPLGSALVFAALTMALLSNSSSAPAIMYAGVSTLAFVLWWSKVATRERLSTACALIPSCLAQPACASSFASLALRPLSAAVTAAGSFLMALSYNACRSAGFETDQMLALLSAQLGMPSTWVLLGGCTLAAFTSSAIVHKTHKVSGGIAGQILCLAFLALSQIMAVRVENGGVWGTPNWATIAVALPLAMLACIVIALRGTLPADEEVDEFDEFA